MSPIVISINDAAKALGLGKSKIYNLIASGELAVIHIGRRSLVPVRSIEALIDRLTTEGAV